MTRKKFQKLCISIGCPPEQARAFKLPLDIDKTDIVIVKNLFLWDLDSYQGCWDFLLHLIRKCDDWYESMKWNKNMCPYKKKPIFHWDRERRASFSIDGAYVNEEILREYVYPPT